MYINLVAMRKNVTNVTIVTGKSLFMVEIVLEL